MKFQRIGTGSRAKKSAAEVARIAIVALMLLSGGMSGSIGFAADDDIPPPLDAESADAPAPDMPNLELSDEGTPAPSLGEDSLPEPSADRAQENAANQVNQQPADDEVFLPAPGGNDSINYAPADRGATRYSSRDEREWQVMRDRPIFTLYAGTAFKDYPGNPSYANDVERTRTTGVTVGASVRVIDLAQTVFAHIYFDYSWYSVGDIGPKENPASSIAQVKDETFHIGPMIEIGVGRRISLFGSLLRRQARVSADKVGVLNVDQQDVGNLVGIGEKPTWQLGVGLQWDFYVIPHGSLGLRGHIEQDLAMVTLALAMEPAPRKKLNLNFDDPY